MKTTLLLACCSFLAMAVLSGCGGSSDGEGSTIALRQLQPTDSFTFEYTTYDGQGNPSTGTSTRSYSLLPSGILQSSEHADDYWPFVKYDNGRGKAILYHSGETCNVDEERYSFPLTFSSGALVQDYENTDSFSLIGPETVTVPAGTFQAFKYDSGNITYWIAPSIGYLVKVTYDDGDVYLLQQYSLAN